jgi:hypothetical protein
MKTPRLDKIRKRVTLSQWELMRKIGAVARRKGLNRPITPEMVRREKL